MSDYIKREDAIELAKDSQADLALEGDNQSFAEELESIPSADVAPVRHGRWEGCKGDITCSACGEYALYDSEDIEMQYRTLYCPFCGAKMDGRKENGTDY